MSAAHNTQMMHAVKRGKILRSNGVYGKSSPVEHLRIYISYPCRRTPLYHPMLILACLTGVTALGFLPHCTECRHGLAMTFLTVRLPVKRVHCDKTEEKSRQIFIPCERSFSLVFWEEEWWVGTTPTIWNFGSTGPRWSEIADFKPIIARSASVVQPGEKSSINTNRKSHTCFPTSLRWSPYIAP